MMQILNDAKSELQPSSALAAEATAYRLHADPEGRVAALLEAFGQSWRDADEAGMAACFTDDADYVTFDGSRFHGAQAIAAMHGELFRTVLKGSRLVGAPPAIRMITQEVAVVRGEGAVLSRGQQTPGRRALSVNTMVVVLRDGRWQIAAFQNTRYRPWSQTWLGRLILCFMPMKTRPEAPAFP